MFARLFKGASGGTTRTRTFAESIADRHGQVCRYLTDGVNLYRFMGSMVSRAGEIVGIENCWSLDIMLVPADELHSRSLRPVTLAAIGE
jgi:hypothetical protein